MKRFGRAGFWERFNALPSRPKKLKPLPRRPVLTAEEKAKKAEEFEAAWVDAQERAYASKEEREFLEAYARWTSPGWPGPDVRFRSSLHIARSGLSGYELSGRAKSKATGRWMS